ncbi:MAG: hypothetical protein J2P48_08955 [Alphaproteobacteria bacterium]|nr:hypothetical protein [Alphaproteobacteria bacterium]
MQLRKWRTKIWAARLSLLALALNALVPVHLAFDLAEVLGPSAECGACPEPDGVDRNVVALLAGHRDADHRSDEHSKHFGCPVCSALAAFASFVPPAAPPALWVPPPARLPAFSCVVHFGRIAVAAAYRSRAPPFA